MLTWGQKFGYCIAAGCSAADLVADAINKKQIFPHFLMQWQEIGLNAMAGAYFCWLAIRIWRTSRAP